jgi:hypothetical protein
VAILGLDKSRESGQTLVSIIPFCLTFIYYVHNVRKELENKGWRIITNHQLLKLKVDPSIVEEISYSSNMIILSFAYRIKVEKVFNHTKQQLGKDVCSQKKLGKV